MPRLQKGSTIFATEWETSQWNKNSHHRFIFSSEKEVGHVCAQWQTKAWVCETIINGKAYYFDCYGNVDHAKAMLDTKLKSLGIVIKSSKIMSLF